MSNTNQLSPEDALALVGKTRKLLVTAGVPSLSPRFSEEEFQTLTKAGQIGLADILKGVPPVADAASPSVREVVPEVTTPTKTSADVGKEDQSQIDVVSWESVSTPSETPKVREKKKKEKTPKAKPEKTPKAKPQKTPKEKPEKAPIDWSLVAIILSFVVGAISIAFGLYMLLGAGLFG